MRRFALVWMAPPTLLALILLVPVFAGDRAFFLRDVFSVHLEMRHAVAAASGDGMSAAGAADPATAGLLVDPARGGGQALAYNPNAVALHPTALAHRVLPFFAAFNLHLALYLLLAPFTLFWLARELGLPRPAAWAAGVTWGFSGFLVSQLAFYNLVAGVTLAPALAAAVVRVCRQRRAGRSGAGGLVAAGLLWALLLTGGDPQTAANALAAAGALALAEPAAGGRSRLATLGLLTGAVTAGTFLALPQVAGLLAILPASARGGGYGEAMRGAGSFDPRQAIGWLLPFAEGRPDLLGPGGFWGSRFHQGSWPFYFSLYPGLATFALLAAAGLPRWRDRHRRRLDRKETPPLDEAPRQELQTILARAWWLVAAGVFLALGRFNPVTALLLGLPGLDTLRYPLKFWLLAAVGGALAAGVGFARAFPQSAAQRGPEVVADATDAPPAVRSEVRFDEGRPRRRALAVLLGFAGLLAALWLVLLSVPATANILHGWMPAGTAVELAEFERARWAGLALHSAVAALALAAMVFLARRRPAAGGVLLLTLHAVFQLYLLAPALVTEETAPYRDTPAILGAVPEDSRVAHGSFQGLFGGPTEESGQLPVPEVRWLFRRTFVEAYPFAGALHGRRYDLNPSPEWLDTRELRLAVAAVRSAPSDAARLRLLAAWGIDRLLLHRPLAEDGAVAYLARALAEEPSVGRRIRAYALPTAAPEVHLASRRLAPPADAPPGSAARFLADPRFRPGRDVVLAPGSPTGGAEGRIGPGAEAEDREAGGVHIVHQTAEVLEVETSSTEPAILVWQRARLPLHRAWVGEREVAVATVNLYRVGVPVPPGEHRVRIEVGRGLLHGGLGGSAAGLLLLAALAFWARRHPPTPAVSAPAPAAIRNPEGAGEVGTREEPPAQ